MWLLTVRDLHYRARRFGVVVMAMSLVLTLLYLMTGLVEQFNKEPFLTADAVGAGTWILPPGVSGPFTSSATLSPDEVETIVAATDASPIVVARATLNVGGEPDEAVVIGQVTERLDAVEVSEGRAPAGPGEVVLDASAGAVTGEKVGLGEASFTVVGLSTDTTLLAGLPVIFAPIEDAREALFGGSEVVSAMVASGVVQEIDGMVVASTFDVGEDALGPLERAISSIDLIRVLLWLVSGIVVGGVIYLTALERQRDFAVLLAVGGTNRQLGSSLAVQGVLLTLLAAGLAAALQVMIVPVFPLAVRVPASAYWQIPLLAGVVAFLATQAGTLKVRRTDPVTAFGGT